MPYAYTGPNALERARAVRKRYRDNNRDKVRATTKRSVKVWAKANPEKVLAQRILNHAVESTKIIRPQACEKCNKHCVPEAHHPDYTKPLEIVWLCKICHEHLHWRKEEK